MKDQFWEAELLPATDYYKKVILDGCSIQKKDVEICDLRFYHQRKYDPGSPRIQVYKKNVGRKEFIKNYHNFDEAISKFISLSK
jgi:hypothetical protein